MSDMEEAGDAQYMDDLFGDSDPVRVPQVKGFSARLEEFQNTGCCQRNPEPLLMQFYRKLDWSKQGCLVSVTSDGRSVTSRAFRRNDKADSWELGPPKRLQLTSQQDEDRIVHVSWNPSGTLLAMYDGCGRVSIHNQTPVLSRLNLKRSGATDPPDESNAIVGSQWLPFVGSQHRMPLYCIAGRNGDNWVYRVANYTANAAHNPIEGKAALVCVTKAGQIRLIYQMQEDVWAETSADMANIPSMAEFLTHADIAVENDGSLSIATHDRSGELRLYRAKIQWNNDPKMAGAAPTFDIRCEAICIDCYPQSVENSDIQGLDPMFQSTSSPPKLLHLKILPQPPEVISSSARHTTVIAIFARPNQSTSLEQSGPQYEGPNVIRRWNVQSVQTKLNSIFDQLATKKKNTAAVGGRQTTQLEQLADIIVDSTVLSLHIYQPHSTLVFYHQDGSVVFRNRNSFDLITPEYKPDRITSIVHCGFAFPQGEPGLHAAFSPNFCLVATRGHDGVPNIRQIEYTFGEISSADEDVTHAIVGLAAQQGTATSQSYSADDILAVLPAKSNPNIALSFIEQIWSASPTALDFTSDEQSKIYIVLLNHPTIQRNLSTQHLFGLSSKGDKRTLSSKFAWLFLNIRACAWVFVRMVKPNESLRAELGFSLAGLLAWSMDLITYLLGELFELCRRVEGQEADLTHMEQTIKMMNSPAVLIILSASSRVVLRLLTRHIRTLTSNVSASLKAGSTNQQNQQNANQPKPQQSTLPPPKDVNQLHALQQLQRIISAAGAPPLLSAIEGITQEAEHAMQSIYKKANINEAERQRAERDFLISIARLDYRKEPTKPEASNPDQKDPKDSTTTTTTTSAAAAPAPSLPNTTPNLFFPPLRHLLSNTIPRLYADIDPGKEPTPQNVLSSIDPARLLFADTAWLGLGDDHYARNYLAHNTVDVIRKITLAPTTTARPTSRLNWPEPEPSESVDGVAAVVKNGTSTAASIKPAARGAKSTAQKMAASATNGNANGNSSSSNNGTSTNGLRPRAPVLRRCARCGARCEDCEYATQRGWESWVVHAQKMCVCGSAWVLGDE